MEHGKWEMVDRTWRMVPAAIENVNIIRLGEGPRKIGGPVGGYLQNMQPEVTNIKRFWIPTINDFHFKSLGIPEQAQKTRLNQKWAQECRGQTKKWDQE